MKKTKQLAHEEVPLRGFFRLKVVEADGTGKTKVVGDSGWNQNLITNLGKDQFLAQLLGAMAGSKQVTFAALGTGGAPIATDTTLAGELGDAAGCRCAVTPTTTNASGTVQFAFTLNSNVITAARNISNVGLFNTSTTQVGTLFAGNTYTSSALATNQAVNGSYQIRF